MTSPDMRDLTRANLAYLTETCSAKPQTDAEDSSDNEEEQP